MPKMVSMELDKKEAEGETVEAQELEKPKYPWGTQLTFNDETLEKLGMMGMPDTGKEFTLTCLVKVTGKSEREMQDKTYKCLDLQITEMGMSPYEESASSKEAKKVGYK